MNKEQIINFDEELKMYNNCEVNIEFVGAVELFLKIDKFKSFVSKQTIILSNGDDKEIVIKVDMITDIRKREKYIIIDMFEDFSIEITKVANADDEFENAGV